MKTRILVVDDEMAFAEAMAERLRIRNYETRICESGADALDILKNEPFDVVILDMVMPEMDGIETLKNIKALTPLTEIILLSGKATLISAVEGMEKGAFEYLSKPCDNDLMVKKIEEAYERKRKQEARIRNAMAEVESVIKDIV